MTANQYRIGAFVSLALLAAASLASAQGAPAPAFTPPKKTAEEKAAQDVLKNFGKLVDERKIDEAFEKYVSKDFHEHDDFASPEKKKSASLRADTLAMFKKDPLIADGLGGKNKTPLIAKAVADEDLVLVDGRIGQDLYRVVDGKITDHWNFADFENMPKSGAGALMPAPAK